MDINSKYIKIVKGLTFLGGMINFLYCLFYLLNINDFDQWILLYGLEDIIYMMIGMVISGLLILLAVKPNDPLPLNWIVLGIFTVLLMIFSFIGGAILILVATVFDVIDTAKSDEKIE